jgi:hypothetical protein
MDKMDPEYTKRMRTLAEKRAKRKSDKYNKWELADKFTPTMNKALGIKKGPTKKSAGIARLPMNVGKMPSNPRYMKKKDK